jgi:hypothetical protein
MFTAPTMIRWIDGTANSARQFSLIRQFRTANLFGRLALLHGSPINLPFCRAPAFKVPKEFVLLLVA